jgi:hypothetical protein
MRSYIIGLCCAAVLAVGGAYAAHASNHAVGRAHAEIVDDLRILHRSRLSFGTIVQSAGTGSVVVTPGRARTIHGRMQMTPGGFAPARFAIRGRANQAYTITVPDEITFTASHPSHQAHGKTTDLTVTDFTIRSDNTGNVANAHSRLDRQGTDRLSVGGTLMVPANAAPGRYSGFVPLTVSY